jgi:tocopherol cyclase
MGLGFGNPSRAPREIPKSQTDLGKAMVNFIRRTLHPPWYQGGKARPPYFEGWYFKLVDPTERYRYAVIATIFKTQGQDTPHAFVQVNDNIHGQMQYVRYPLRDFHAAEDQFAVHIGPNYFAADELRLNLATDDLTLRGELHFRETQPWPMTLLAPGAMGWYAWVPRMECYQGVVSLDHTIDGTLTIAGEDVDFTKGRGYTEKTWGQSFPIAWIWLQSNHFETPGTSLFGAISMIPWIGRTFRGFTVGLLHHGILYRFATYTGAETVHLAVTPQRIRWVIRDHLYRLEIIGDRGTSVDLRGPKIGRAHV